MSGTEERFLFAREVIQKAGMLALDYFRDFAALTVHNKGTQDMASEADVNTENLIREAVSGNFPGDAFLGEESSETFRLETGKGTWIVDPIDGTQPFVNGIPSWCISMAYVEGHQILLGLTFDPVSNELFAARHRHGAYLNEKPIRPASVSSLKEGLVCVGYSNRVSPEATLEPLTRLMHAGGMYHRNGSGALSLAYVGAGRLIGYFEPHMNSWDFAAGALIVREAGGRTNDCLPEAQTMIDGGLMVAAAQGVYQELSAVVSGDL